MPASRIFFVMLSGKCKSLHGSLQVLDLEIILFCFEVALDHRTMQSQKTSSCTRVGTSCPSAELPCCRGEGAQGAFSDLVFTQTAGKAEGRNPLWATCAGALSVVAREAHKLCRVHANIRAMRPSFCLGLPQLTPHAVRHRFLL